MPFIRGIIFSSELLDGSQALRDQLQLLSWGGLHLAVLRPEDAPAAESASETASAPPLASDNKYGCDALAVLQLPAATSADDGVTSAAEAAAASWAAGEGLQWPAEVLLLGAPWDGVGRLHHLQQQQQQQSLTDSGTPIMEMLPGIHLGSGEGAQAAPWQRLRLALAHANLRRALADAPSEQPAPPPPPAPLIIVGTAMKASRERDLAREGLMNLVPQDGLVFAPLDLSVPLEQQLPFHVILHKASDELEYGEDGVPRFGARVRGLADFAAAHPGGVSLVDPLESAAKVINRTELARVCDSLALLDLGQSVAAGAASGSGGGDGRAAGSGAAAAVDGADEGGAPGAKRQRLGPRPAVRVRAPRNTTVASFAREEVEAARERLGCPPPYIVKPVVACGTSDSHQMALVLLPEALEGLPLPLPAVVQEFVNHDATIYKAYVAGDKVFHTVRPSIPNLPQDREMALQVAPSGTLLFDSLKSLPTALHVPRSDQLPAAGAAAAAPPAPAPPPLAASARAAAPSQAVLERLAAYLRSELGLSLFGFDVVVAAHGGRHGGGHANGAGGAAGGDGGDGGVDSNGGGGNGEERRQEYEGAEQDLVVVDINYFPSYRGAEGAPALFRAAVRGAHQRQQQQRQQEPQEDPAR